MTQWEYVKGSQADFEGAPEWATLRTYTGGRSFYAEHHDKGAQIYDICAKDIFLFNAEFSDLSMISVTAERRKLDNPQSRVNDANLADALKEMFKEDGPGEKYDKYNRPCKDVTIDVYDVLVAFNVTNPALQHLIKKALAVGQRGHKDKNEDLNDILASAKRAIEIEGRYK